MFRASLKTSAERVLSGQTRLRLSCGARSRGHGEGGAAVVLTVREVLARGLPKCRDEGAYAWATL